MPIEHVYLPPQGDPLEILLALLEDEVRPRHCPALDDLRQVFGAFGGEAEEVGGAEGKVSEDLEVADAVAAELELGGGEKPIALAGGSFERVEVGGLDGAG